MVVQDNDLDDMGHAFKEGRKSQERRAVWRYRRSLRRSLRADDINGVDNLNFLDMLPACSYDDGTRQAMARVYPSVEA